MSMSERFQNLRLRLGDFLVSASMWRPPKLPGRSGAVVILVAGLFVGVLGAQGSDKPKQVESPYDLDELKRMLEVAQESGFTEEELRKITVEDDNGVSINAYEFIQALETRRLNKIKAAEALRRKVYLTPQDIISELDTRHGNDLDTLRQEMIFLE